MSSDEPVYGGLIDRSVILKVVLTILLILSGQIFFNCRVASSKYYNDWLYNFSLNNPHTLLNVMDGVSLMWSALTLACFMGIFTLWDWKGGVKPVDPLTTDVVCQCDREVVVV